jgi:hypothetical protein
LRSLELFQVTLRNLFGHRRHHLLLEQLRVVDLLAPGAVSLATRRSGVAIQTLSSSWLDSRDTFIRQYFPGWSLAEGLPTMSSCRSWTLGLP